MEDEERQPEHPEGVLGPQLAVVDVHVELLGEAVHRKGGELTRLGVDVGQVVAGMVEVAATGQHQATVGPGAGDQRGGEARLREREADADVAAPVVPVGGVDADVDRFVVVGEGADPAAHGDGIVLVEADRVDAAADPPQCLPLVHGHARLAQGTGDHSSDTAGSPAAPSAATRGRCRA